LGGSTHSAKSSLAACSFSNDVAAMRAMQRILDFLQRSNYASTLPIKEDNNNPADSLKSHLLIM